MTDQREIEVAGAGEGSDALLALSDALVQAQAGLIAAGAGPHHMKSMVWAAPDPASIHPRRREVDGVFREAFGGNKVPVSVEVSPDDYIHVSLRAVPPAAPLPDDVVWQNYSVMELAKQMSPRNQVPDMIGLFRQWTRDGQQAREQLGGLDIAYGPAPDHRLDLYRPEGKTNPPIWAFIHGGYWQASSKDQHPQFLKAMLDNGFAVANIDYRLAPEAPLSEIVKDVRMALNFLVDEAGNLGVDGQNLNICGHSAGGHLTAFAASDPQCPPIRSALPLSGIFDLEALRLIPMGPVLGLNSPEISLDLSPIHKMPAGNPRIRVALGALESDEFKRQSAELAKKWNAPTPLQLEDANHFSLLDGLNSGPLFQLALETARGD